MRAYIEENAKYMFIDNLKKYFRSTWSNIGYRTGNE